jgi:hypothetical protein
VAHAVPMDVELAVVPNLPVDAATGNVEGAASAHAEEVC